MIAVVLALAPAAARAEPPVNGIPIGAPIRTVLGTLGPPTDVASLDSGNRFGFGATSAYVDDDGMILAVETRAGNPRIEVDGRACTFAVGSYSIARADAELVDVAEFSGPTLRTYRLAPRRDLVLSFSAATNRLERVVYGEPGQLARLGLLPGDAAAKAVPYRAPVPRHGVPAAQPAGTAPAVYRLRVDRAGIVTRVDEVTRAGALPADDAAAKTFLTKRFAPATFGGRPIAATVFVNVTQ